MTDIATLEQDILTAWKEGDDSPAARDAVARALELLDQGSIRVAQKQGAEWTVNEWVKMAVLLYFRFNDNGTIAAGDLSWYDKVPVKGNWRTAGVRAVPPAVARFGSFVEQGAVLMPCYVNIGARVGSGTMIDTWATVGSCAQIGRNCHISGGVGIGGVLEPVQASPVIVEDNVFVGARSEIAEGVVVEEGAVLAMGCFVGASTRIFDCRTGSQRDPGRIPPRAVCVPGALPSPDGTHSTYAIVIKKYRDEKTDARTALNSILRDGGAP